MYRSFEDRIFGGVCGGLAQITPLNAMIWRLVFVLLALATVGVGLLAYILLWWLLPQESLVSGERGHIGWSLLAILGLVVLLGGWFLRDQWMMANGSSWYGLLAALILALAFFFRQFLGGARFRTDRLLALVVLLSILVALSGVFGLLPEGILDVFWRAVPGLLVFVGLTWLLRDRLPLGGGVALLTTGVLIGGLATLAFSARSTQYATENEQIITESIGAEVVLLQVNIEALETDVDFFGVTGNDRAIEIQYTGSRENLLEVDYALGADGLATFTLRETRPNPYPLLDAVGRGRLRIALPRDLALAISFAGAQGTSLFDMTALNLERLNVDMIRGDVTVTLPAYQPLSPSVAQNPGELRLREGNLRLVVPARVGGQFVLNRDRSIRPQFDSTLYLLIDDGADGTLQAIGYDGLDIKIRYTLTVPRGQIRLDIADAGQSS